jgi:hypothetical protein
MAMRSFEERMDLAAAALAQGFYTKAARKDALDQVSRAYDGLRSAIHNQLLQMPHEARDEAWHAIYDMPYQVSSWRPKHAALLAPRFPAEVAQLEAAAALRAEIKAAPEVAKPAREKTAAELAWEAEAMTCQCCARPICAKTGRIAHHGYERPGGGYQTASCYGARKLPFEVSRDALGQLIEALKIKLAAKRARLPRVVAETVSVPFRFTDYDAPYMARIGRPEVVRQVTRATLAAVLAETKDKRKHQVDPTFDDLKGRMVRALEGEIAGLVQDITWQEERFNGWKQTHRREGAAWIALEGSI